jgi:glycosyltransferase involved in cell wall biosynthesis
VFVGGMDLYANRSAVQLLVGEIWPRLASDPSWRLIIVGRNPIPELLEAARDPRVSAPGFVNDVRPYVAAAGIYVCPIRDGGGTRLKVLDALAMGKALIATRLAVEGIEVEDGVHYLSAETVDDFVAQIRRVAAQSDLRKALGREGRAFVEARYGWESIGKRLLDAYEFASARRRSASERDRSNRNPSV